MRWGFGICFVGNRRLGRGLVMELRIGLLFIVELGF